MPKATTLQSVEETFAMAGQLLTTPEQDEKQRFAPEFSTSNTFIWPWADHKEKLARLHQDWGKIHTQVANDREVRKADVNVKDMRASGKIAKDAGMYPRRIVDTNIERAKPPFVAYLKLPTRTALFECEDRFGINTDKLEVDFTRVSRFEGWEEPHFKCLDAAWLSGWAGLQTLFDPDKPGHFSHKFLATDKFMFPIGITDIQMAEYVSVIVDTTVSKLKSWVKKFGFDADQVDMLAQKSSAEYGDTVLQVYQLLYKADNGTVYTAWYHESCMEWLKVPKPLFLGKKLGSNVRLGEIQSAFKASDLNEDGGPLYETEFPIDIFVSHGTEESSIVENRGRAFYDYHTQEAQTSMWTGFINKLVRSSNIYASPKAANTTRAGAPSVLENSELRPDHMYDKAVDFWSTPSPDGTAILAAQALAGENSQETGALNVGVLNRKDARKTKKEFEVAESAQSGLDGISVTRWSTFQTAIVRRSWAIAQARARQGDLPNFLRVVEPGEDETTDTFKANDKSQERLTLLECSFVIKSAGENDVVQKQRMLSVMQEFWPVASATSLKLEFMIDMLKQALPDQADRYEKILRTEKPTGGIIQALATTLQAVSQNANLPPEAMQKVQDVLAGAQEHMKSAGEDGGQDGGA